MSLAFDESVQKVMSNYLVSVNRLRHAMQHVASLDDPTQMRELMRMEQNAEAECVRLLVQRGWQPPGGLAPARRAPTVPMPMPRPA